MRSLTSVLIASCSLWTAIGLVSCRGSRQPAPQAQPVAAAGPEAAKPSPAASGDGNIEIAVTRAMTLRDVEGRIVDVLARARLGKECALVWGDPRPATPAPATFDFTVAGQAVFSGLVLCDDALEATLDDPRLEGLGLVAWIKGSFRMAHPSDTSSTSPLPPARDQPWPGLAQLHGNDDSTTIGEIASALPSLPRSILLLVWGI